MALRKWARWFAIALLILVGYPAMFQPRWITDRLSRLSPRVLYAVRTQEKAVALTLDDGPDGVTTPAILDILRENDAHATFFLIADRLKGSEALIERIVEEGHELGNHMLGDQPSIRLTPAEFEMQLVEAHERLSAFGPVRWFRPGSGWFNEAMLTVLKRHQYRTALGSVYPFDAHLPWSAFAQRYILWRVEPGAVIILHDHGARGERTAQTLAAVLPELRARGYRIVSLSELMGLAEQAAP